MSERPLLIPLFSVMAGIMAASQSRCFLPEPLFFSLLAASFLLLFLRTRVPFLACLSLCFFVWGDLAMEPYLAHRFAPESIVHHAGRDPLLVEGVIDGRPEWEESGGKLTLRVTRLFSGNRTSRASGRLMLYLGEGRGKFLTGDLIRFESRIRRPRNFGVPGEFDYERYLAFRGIRATAFVPAAADVLLVRSGVSYPFRHFMDGAAANLGCAIGRLVPGESGAVLRALILGEGDAIPEATRDLYARTGVSHILSISGFHVGVVAFFIFHILFGIARRSQLLLLHADPRRSALFLTLPFLLFYLFLSGSAPSTVRSVIMITAFIAALLLDRESDPLNSLILAALLILGFSPPALFDISFQLSFMAIWGIITLTPILMSPFREMGEGIPRKLLLFLMVSAAATAATLVPVSFHFQRATLTGLAANFFVIPLMGYGAVVLGFSALPFIKPFPPAAELILSVAGFLVDLSGRILAFLDRLPMLPALDVSGLDFVLAFLALAVVGLVSGTRARIACFCAIAVIFTAGRIPSNVDPGKLRIDFFSVGQGESTLITFPDGKRMLVDGGGSATERGIDPGKRLLVPALRSMGIDRLDYVVLTHTHPDHLRGLLFPIRSFEVGEFWETGLNDGCDDYLELKGILAEKGAPIRRVDASTGPIRFGPARIEFLSPSRSERRAAGEEGGDLNEGSLVFRLGMDDFAVLFTGDIGPVAEGRLSANPSALRCTVLKTPHHGSRRSSSERFLDAAAPQCSLIGAGYDNRFSLPAAETLARFSRRGVDVYRTDLDGTLTVVYGNGKWNVSTFRGAGHFN